LRGDDKVFSREDELEMYRKMYLIRTFEEQAEELYA